MAEPSRRRRRVTNSCMLCRRRKLKCDRESPCGNCTRSGNQQCVYERYPSRPAQQQTRHTIPVIPTFDEASPQSTTSSGAMALSTKDREPTAVNGSRDVSVNSPTNGSVLEDKLPDESVKYMKRRIRHLESQLSKTAQTHNVSSTTVKPIPAIETVISDTSGTVHFVREERSLGRSRVLTSSVFHKSRLFGQSHYFNGAALFRDLMYCLDPHTCERASEISDGLKRCKSVAKTVKARRTPRWPVQIMSELPRKDIADELVERYLRTFESVYRILYVPTFKKHYEALWVSDMGSDAEFVVQLKIVLALGATVYDDTFSLRESATRWVYEAQAWLSNPELKSKPSIRHLQINLLVLLARDAVGVGKKSTWTSAGALLRTAMYMGLHRDPARLPKRSDYTAEMHRRLWNTILELNLQLSMAAGGAPLLSFDDFDTEPPRNFDDDDLAGDAPEPKPANEFTQMSVAIALRKTLPVRLAVTRLLNDVSSRNTYEETLELDAELREAYKTLRTSLQECSSVAGHSPSHFQTQFVDFIMQRYISSLHIPLYAASLQETTYAYSRKTVTESSLRLWYTAYPDTFKRTVQTPGDNIDTSDQRDLSRLATCSAGFCRSVALQSAFLIAAELRAQLRENEGLGPAPLRTDLLSVVMDAKRWTTQTFEAGETNVKGLLLVSMILAQIEALMEGVPEQEITDRVVNGALEAERVFLTIFESQNLDRDANEMGLEQDRASLTTSSLTDDWDCLMPEAMFSFGSMDPGDYTFDDAMLQEPVF